MKAILGQGQVQASNSLGANGGVLGAMVGLYAKKKDYEIRRSHQESLMEFDHQLKERRQLNGAVYGIAADLASQATNHNYTMIQESAKAKNKITQTKAEAAAERRTYGYKTRTDQKAMRDQTAGLETTAGLPLSGGISVGVIKPGENAGQLQALKDTDIMKGQSRGANNPTTVITPDTSNPEMPAAAKGGRGKKTKPFADPSVEKNVKPVPSEVASPFGAPETRSTIFADASSPKISTPAAESPAAETPAARIKKA
jgi:hypothetical protein